MFMRNNPIRHRSHNHGPGQVNDIRENSTFNHTFSLDSCKVFKNRDLIIRDIITCMKSLTIITTLWFLTFISIRFEQFTLHI